MTFMLEKVQDISDPLLWAFKRPEKGTEGHPPEMSGAASQLEAEVLDKERQASRPVRRCLGLS